MCKGAGSVSIIGGTDEPTSIFIAGKGDKVKRTTRIQNYFRKIKRNRIKKRITANPHTLEEVKMDFGLTGKVEGYYLSGRAVPKE